jgi:aryl-phospho-beta-D-glucosidase BglC (GH1 family)
MSNRPSVIPDPSPVRNSPVRNNGSRRRHCVHIPSPAAVLALLISVLAHGAVTAAPPGTGGFYSTRGTEILDPTGAPVLLRGINLGNWLVPEGYMFKFTKATSPRLVHEVIAELVGPDDAARFWAEYRDAYITADDIAFIKASGLNSIRVPFNYRLLTPEEFPGLWRGPGFEMLDRVIGWCRDAGLGVILDMHCAPGGQTGDNIDDSWGYPFLFESEESQRRFIDIWVKIAGRYRDETIVIGYDLMNEPIAHYFDVDRLNPRLEPLYKRTLRAIRDVDTNHIVFIAGAQWNGNFRVLGPPFDARLVYTCHRYWSDTTQAAIQDFIDFRDTHSVPMWLGESGENTDEWISAFRRRFEEQTMGWCFWPYKKMDATSCMVTFDRPEGYDLIEAYANGDRSSFEARRKARPEAAAVRAALAGFLKNCRFERTRVNEGYLKALGLR